MDIGHWHVLIVEDEFDSVQMISKILQHYGARVAIAHNGHECLSLLTSFEPTFVMMDLALPEMDGWETLRRMRANPSTMHIPVVAMTAYHSASVAQDAEKAGFDGYFSKPLDTTKLIHLLAAVLER